jgi:hypothetical protein
VSQYRSTAKTSASNAEAIAASPASQEQCARSSPDARDPAPEEKTKQKKHSKVHKRERELYGLVTPAFLPLLDARDASPEKRKEKKLPKPEPVQRANNTANTAQAGAGAARDAERSKDGRKSRKDHQDMEGTAVGEPGRESQQPDATKKPKRTTMKKSALRRKDTPRTRRKRVSLQIDGQTVLPADTVIEPPLASPGSATTSASNSTASLDDMIDPLLTAEDGAVYIEHRDAVHHSLPLPMSNAIHSPIKPLPETPTSISILASNTPPSPHTLSMPFGSAQHATRTFLDPSPGQLPPSIPETASPEPIYSTSMATSAELDIDDLAAEEQHFDTYVGGLHGSGVDDVDQAGSYGYPSSLGASYMESYMQNRPLSVRMNAADKAGLDETEKKKLLEEKGEEDEEDSWVGSSTGSNRTRVKETDEDNFMGDMEDFE